MSEHTPSKGVVRGAYVLAGLPDDAPADLIQSALQRRSPEFDRFIDRVRRDAAQEALDGLAEQEARACDRGDLTPDALHIHASTLACVERYARDHYPEGDDQ